MFDVLVTVLVALFSFPYLHQENVTPSPLAILVVVALTVPLVVRRIWPSAVFGWLFGVSAAAGLWNVRLVVSFALVVALVHGRGLRAPAPGSGGGRPAGGRRHRRRDKPGG